MKTINSAEFRKTYARLREPVIVMALGRPIGKWDPRIVIEPIGEGEVREVITQDRVDRTRSQSMRDDWLRKINKGG